MAEAHLRTVCNLHKVVQVESRVERPQKLAPSAYMSGGEELEPLARRLRSRGGSAHALWGASGDFPFRVRGSRLGSRGIWVVNGGGLALQGVAHGAAISLTREARRGLEPDDTDDFVTQGIWVESADREPCVPGEDPLAVTSWIHSVLRARVSTWI